MNLPAGVAIRPIRADDDAAMAAVIRTVMPEFGATGCGFAINDPEVDWMSLAYAEPRHAYFVVERDGAVLGGGGVHAATPRWIRRSTKNSTLPRAPTGGCQRAVVRAISAIARADGLPG